MLLSRDFTLKFKCDFNLQYFPFDTQSCMILINANIKVKNFVQLTPTHLEYTGPRDLLNFEVIAWHAEIDKTESDVHIRNYIVLKRKVAQIMVTVYFPSLCIMVVAQVNNFLGWISFVKIFSGNFVFQGRAF